MDSNKNKIVDVNQHKKVVVEAVGRSLVSRAKPFVIAAAALLIIAVVFSVFMLPKTATGGVGLEEAAEFSPSLKDSASYKALAENGFENAVVESKQNEVLVYLQVEQGAGERQAAFVALGAAGALAEPESTVKVQVEKSGGKTTYSASAADVHALLDGKMGDEEFESRVSVA